MGHETADMKKLLIVIGILFLLVIMGISLDIFSGKIFLHITQSLYRMVVGYILAVAVGFVFSVIFGANVYLRMMFKPVLSFFIAIPTITWVPLLLVVTGITEKTIILAIFLGSFFAIVFNTLDGFDNIDPNLVRVGQLLGYSKLHLLLKVYIPASFNNILVGLKLGIAYSWRALVGAEMLGAASVGLGYLTFASRKFYNIPLLLLSLSFIGLLGYLLNRIIVEYVEVHTIEKWGLQ
jgi:NitT/TauT family transport system permease protein